MKPHADTVTRLIRDIVAEEVVTRFERLAHGDVSEKAPGDLVTIADVQTERRLTEALTQLLPGSRSDTDGFYYACIEKATTGH